MGLKTLMSLMNYAKTPPRARNKRSALCEILDGLTAIDPLDGGPILPGLQIPPHRESTYSASDYDFTRASTPLMMPTSPKMADAAAIDEHERNVLTRLANQQSEKLAERNLPTPERQTLLAITDDVLELSPTPQIPLCSATESLRIRSTIEARAAVAAVDEQGQTVLHRAAKEGQIDTLERLSKDDVILLMWKDKHGNTPLLSAALEGQCVACKILLAAGSFPTMGNARRWNALHCAASSKNSEVVELFADNAALREEKDIDGRTPLIIATLCGHHAACKILLAAGADPKATDRDGHDALYWAKDQGRWAKDVGYKIIEQLLTAKLDEEAAKLLEIHAAREKLLTAMRRGASMLPPHLQVAIPASEKSETPVFQVQRGGPLPWPPVKIHEWRDKDDNTPLLSAALGGQQTACETLLAAGADLQKVNARGWNALHCAVSSKNSEVVRLFAGNVTLREGKDRWTYASDYSSYRWASRHV